MRMNDEGKSEASLPTIARFIHEVVFDYDTSQIYFTVDILKQVFTRKRYHEQKKDGQEGLRRTGS